MNSFDFLRDVVSLKGRMFRFAQSLLLSADEAEDVVCDLLESLWRDRARMAECRNVASFCLTAVRNRCCDRLRRRRSRRDRDRAVACTAERETTAAADGWEARDLVRRAMELLPERQREVLHLREIEGWPMHEIAAVVGCDEAQVRMILSRARRALRERLIKMMSDERTNGTD